MSASILCGVDGSPASGAALTIAARLASRLDRRLVVAHVAEPIPFPAHAPLGRMGGHDLLTENVATHEEAATRLAEHVARAAGVEDAEHRGAVGLPAERLADLADDEDAELIVVASRGHGPLKSAFLGSVSNSLVGIARCPVLIVGPGATESS